MDFDYSGKSIVITGGASGIGLATARAFAQAGASVAVADMNGEAAEKAAAEIVAAGGKAIAIQCDVAD